MLAIGNRMEPIQLQKTLFKFAKESGAPLEQTYDFVPYNWGPCSFKIYDDLAQLRTEHLIEFVPTGSGWSVYRQTKQGINQAGALSQRAQPELLAALHQSRDYVVSRSFEQLLKDI